MFFGFDSASVANEMELIEEDGAKVRMFREKVKYGLTEKYNWDVIADKYKSEFIKLIQ